MIIILMRVMEKFFELDKIPIHVRSIQEVLSDR